MVQRVLQYIDLKRYESAMIGINEMEKITPNSTTIHKLREYLKEQLKLSQK